MLTRALVTITLALTAASSAHAQDAVSNFYKGRQLTVIIPSSVGGGYDLYGRLVARHIGKHLPGNPNVVASNMAGAAGVVAAQYVYAAGAKDGSVLGLVYPNWSTEVTPMSGKWRVETVEINAMVVISGIRVYPGDLVVADDTGVCFVPREDALRVLAYAQKKAKSEEDSCARIEAGVSVPELAGAPAASKK